MADSLASASLFDFLEETGYRSSVIATYNCYFPFYEEVVLRRLMAAGCAHNVLMMDATRCAEAFANDDLRPRRAGRDYTLIPVRLGGAFHPKMFLHLGRSKGTLLVGSHNLTLSGFGLNNEVTNIFHIEGSGLRTTADPLRRAFQYLAGFVPTGLTDVVESFEGLKLGVPWMDGPLGTGDSTRLLLTASDSGPDLWSQVVPLVPREVATAFICGPFFDPSLALVRRIQRELQPKELVIGIDPKSVEIDPSIAAALENVRWVNLERVVSIPPRREDSFSYLHAKIFWFVGKDEELLLTGSANPSVAAFFAPASSRNAEAVVVDRRMGAGDELGLRNLVDAPPISAADWTSVTSRRSTKTMNSIAPSRSIVIGTPTPTGFCTHDSLPQDLVLRGLNHNNTPIGEATVRESTVIEAPEAVRDHAVVLEGDAAERHLVVLVHRTEEIAKNLGGDTRKALRQALGALEEDPNQLETLLKLTEKVIFDSEDIIRTTPLRPIATPSETTEMEQTPTTLALDAAGRKTSRRRRNLANGDLAVLLDALMHRLGEGLPVNASSRSRNDQDEIGGDEEDGGELAYEPPDYETIAKACRKKVKRLLKRLDGQLQLASAQTQARRGIVQLAAVLSLLYTLRLITYRPEWRRSQAGLVNQEDLRHLFETAVPKISWTENALASQAVIENEGEVFDELSMAVGLLAWTAWDAEVDAEKAFRNHGRQGVEDQRWYDVQFLATLGPWLFGDKNAMDIFEKSVTRTPRYQIDSDKWLRTNFALLEAYAKVVAAPEFFKTTDRPACPGDLVILNDNESPRVRVILDVRQGGGGDKMVIFDPEAVNHERTFLVSRLGTLPWPYTASEAVTGSVK